MFLTKETKEVFTHWQKTQEEGDRWRYLGREFQSFGTMTKKIPFLGLPPI